MHSSIWQQQRRRRPSTYMFTSNPAAQVCTAAYALLQQLLHLAMWGVLCCPIDRKRDGAKADLLEYGMPTKRKGGAAGASVLDLDTAGNYRPRTKVRKDLAQQLGSQRRAVTAA